MSTTNNLFQWYLANQEQLIQKYNGKYIVIKDNSVVDDYTDENEAYLISEKKYGLGNFIIQLCTPGDDAYTIHIYTPQYSF